MFKLEGTPFTSNIKRNNLKVSVPELRLKLQYILPHHRTYTLVCNVNISLGISYRLLLALSILVYVKSKSRHTST